MGFAGAPSDLDRRLEGLRQALAHRGPDAHGQYVSREGSCGLVHARLAILGLAPSGRQPMTVGDQRYWITFNGEIYNFRTLRRELESQGCRFVSESDTEVILQLFLREGPRCVDRLEGMFAFVIWDSVEQSAFAARDPFGIKPLYYRIGHGGELLFASEVKALLRADPGPHALNPDAALGYLLSGSVPEPETLIQGVRSLPAGHRLFWKAGRISLESFWNPEFPIQPMDWTEAVTTARAALEDSIQRHFVSDVPVGVFLSGGLDSTALVALASRIGVRELRTFSLQFEEAAFDESEVARRTAAHFGYSFEPWRLNAEAARPVLAEYLEAMDQPSIDGFNTFCVSRHAHRSGMKVVLSGLGGDELFGGYASFRRMPQLMIAMKALQATGMKSLVRRMLSKRSGPRRRLAAALAAAPNWGITHWAMRGIFTPAEALSLLPGYVEPGRILPSPEQLLSRLVAAPGPKAPPTPRDWVSRMEFERYLRNQLLRDSDVFSMAWAMELRVPFVDRALFDRVARIPAAHRLATGKKLLQAAVPELPEWVTKRRKQGFVVPFSKWALSEWQDELGATESRSAIPLTTWYQRWALFALDRFISTHGLQR